MSKFLDEEKVEKSLATTPVRDASAVVFRSDSEREFQWKKFRYDS